MASLTIRNLDSTTKENLRIIAAKNQRSMEEEARHALGQYIDVKANSVEIDNQSKNYPQQMAQNSVNERVMMQIPSEQATNPSQTGNSSMAVRHSSIAPSLKTKNILLIIGGGIAAYKSLDLIRRLKERGAAVRVVMTPAAQQFVTPLAAGALAGGHVFTELFSRTDEQDIGHIRLSREADLIIVAPATADRLAKLAAGIGDDLAGAILLASKAPVLLVPAMNPAMWAKSATQRNVKTLMQDGYQLLGPEIGEMAEHGEAGRGRMSEPIAIAIAVERLLSPKPQPLSGKHIIVTSGPTREPIDPVRYIANRSSGKQGHAIAQALSACGARVTLISGPVALQDPERVKTIHVETAQEMLQAVNQALPADAAIFVAAVADWRSETIASHKIKKNSDAFAPIITLKENPDILATIGHSPQRPKLVIGFAAETNNIIANAKRKLKVKGADLIIVNDVAANKNGQSVMGGERNQVTLINKNGEEQWPEMDKKQVAEKLAERITKLLKGK